MNKEQKVDIIVLTYNFLENTKECIDSLFKNTDNFRLILLDNGSTDGSEKYILELAGKHDNVRSFIAGENLGVIEGRNQAYNLAQKLDIPSDIIIFLDNDQFVQYGWLNSYLEMMIIKKFDIVGIEAWMMKENPKFYPYKKINDIKDSSFFSYVGAGGMAIKKRVIDDIGLFDNRFFIYYEDPDFIWRAHDKGYKIGWNSQKVIIHQYHSLLGKDNKRKEYFHNSWLQFKKKWGDKQIPVFDIK